MVRLGRIKKTSFYILIFYIFISLSFVSAARLPTVGGDDGNWGSFLNEYLNTSLGENATSLNIPEGNLTLGQKVTFAFGEIIDNIIDGWIRINGNLNVTGDLHMGGAITHSSPVEIREGIALTNGSYSHTFTIYNAHGSISNVSEAFDNALIFQSDEIDNPNGMEVCFWDKENQIMYFCINEGGSQKATTIRRSFQIVGNLTVKENDQNFTLCEGNNYVDCQTDATGADLFVQDDIEAQSIYANENFFATENVTASYFVGNGSQLTNLNWNNIANVPFGFSDDVDNNTLYYAGEIYIYDNGSNYFFLNETKLNETISNEGIRLGFNSTYNSTYDAKSDYQFGFNNFNGSGNFTTSGRIGIGTNSPNAKLYVDQNSNNEALIIDSDSTTERVVDIQANSLTSGSAMRIYSGSSNTDTRYLLEIFQQNSGASGTYPLYVHSNDPDGNLMQLLGGKVTHTYNGDGGIAHSISSNSLETGVGFSVTTNALTTGKAVSVTGDGLTTGKLARFYSNSVNESDRNLFEIVNDNTAATGATGLYIQQDSTGLALDVRGDVDIIGDLNVTGTSYLGEVTLTSDNITVNNILPRDNGTVSVEGNLNITGDIIPSSDDTYSLGSVSQRWSELFVGPGTVHVGNSSNFGSFGYNASGNYLLFDPDGDTSHEIVFTDTGRIGIGTTTPVSALDVNGSVGIGENNVTSKLHVSLDQGNQLWTPANTIATFEDDAFGFIDIVGDSVAGIKFSDNEGHGVGGVHYDHAENLLSFLVDDGEKMWLDSSGRIGMGTSTPAYGLDIVKSTNSMQIRLSDINTDGETKTGGIVSRHLNNSEEDVSGIAISSSSTENEIKYGGGSTNKNSVNKHTFYTGTSTTQLQGIETLTIQNDNVTVDGLLTVLNNVSANYFLGDGSQLTGIDQGLWTNSSGNATFTTGRVGIGTSSPSAKLEISGATSSVAGSALYFNPAFADGVYVNFGEIRTIGVFEAGNLFMGYNTYYDNINDSYEYATNLPAAVTEWTNSGDINFLTKSTGTAGQEYTPDSRMIIKNSGNVGIGTDSPDQFLQLVRNDGDNPVYLKVSNINGTASGEAGILLTLASNENVDDIGAEILADRTNSPANGGTDLIFKNSNGSGMQTNMIVKGSGSVGIGTTSPASPLEIESNTAGLQTLRNTIAGQGSFTQWYDHDNTIRLIVGTDGNFYSGTDNQASIATWTNHSLAFFTNQVQRMILDTSGNLGIGTSSPANDLEIEDTGDTTVLRIQDSSNTCDFGVDGSGWASISCVSDESLKEDIHEITNETFEEKADWVFDYPLKEYTIKANNETQIGVIAQEIQELDPTKVKNITVNDEESNKTEEVLAVEVPSTSDLILAIKKLREMFDELVGGNYSVETKPVFDEDSVGTAMIKINETEVYVKFSKEYEVVPIVTLTTLEFINGQYKVSNKTTKGFKIELQEYQEIDVSFDWHAFAREVVSVTLNETNITDSTNVTDVSVNESLNETVVRIVENVIEEINESFSEEVVDEKEGEVNGTFDENKSNELNESITDEGVLNESVGDVENFSDGLDLNESADVEVVVEEVNESDEVVVEVDEGENVSEENYGSLITGAAVGVRKNEYGFLVRFGDWVREVFGW